MRKFENARSVKRFSYKNKLRRLLGPIDLNSAAAREWEAIIEAPTFDDSFRKRANRWLKLYRTDPAAGAALVILLHESARPRYVKTGKAWIRQYGTHSAAPLLAGALLEVDASQGVVDLCVHYINTIERTEHLTLILKAMHKRPRASQIFEAVERRIEKCPSAREWEFSLAPIHNQSCKSAEKLIIKWIELNAEDSSMGVLRFLAPPPTPAILEACFEWSVGKGRELPGMPAGLPYLLDAAESVHKQLAPKVIDFAREWLAKHPEHESVGRLYHSVILATKALDDILAAKDWYNNHQENKTASFVITALLVVAAEGIAEIKPFALSEAKRLLADAHFRENHAAMLRSLVRLVVDDETRAWAKEAALNHPELLVPVLLQAPDAESLAIAEAKCHKQHPELINAILSVDRRNATARRLGRAFLKMKPQYKYYSRATRTSIRQLLK